MKAKSKKEPQAETEALNQNNIALKKELAEVSKAYEQIKAWNIDALVKSNENGLNVYTDKTADKPYRLLIEKMHEGAVTLNEEGIILYCNSYFAKLVNLPLHKILGTNFEKFITASLREHFASLLKSRAIAFKEELYLYAADSSKIPVLMTINSFLLENISIVSIIFTDLTLQKESQKKLETRTKQLEHKNRALKKANEELAFQIGEKEKRGAELSIANIGLKELEDLIIHKENVLATISHDLRSPLASIIGMTDLLNEDYDSMDQGTIKTMLGLLFKASTNELKMLDYLLEWARIKYASDAFFPAEISVNYYVKQAFEALNDNAVSKNLHLHNEIKEDISVFADSNMLSSIIQNIVSNSIKHSYIGGEIVISAERNVDKIIVEIKDHGIGMSKGTREKLFVPQIISLSKTRDLRKGAGIGLLLVKGFLEKMGGEIWVKSIVGEGSSFFFSLPVAKSQYETNITETKKSVESL